MMLLIVLLAGALRATHTPASPTVGDRVAIRFDIARDESVVLDPSPDYEVVSRSRDAVVLRAFKPQPLALSGRITGPHGAVTFRRLILPMRSVLRKADDRKPAPLVPPMVVPTPQRVWIALAIAAALALLTWGVLYRVTRQRSAPVIAPPLAPEEELHLAVAAIRLQRRLRWAALADATRRYLSRCAPASLGSELTTRELLRHLPSVSRSPEWQSLVGTIVTEGDLDKFSPWGASSDVGSILDETVRLLPQPFQAAQETAA
jgi:hypothetical protein